MTESREANSSRIPPHYVHTALLFLLTFAAFWPGLSGGRVWDDISLPVSRVFTGHDALRQIWTNPAAAYREEHYWPVVYTAFWLQLKLWGSFDQVAGFKLFNLILHSLNSFMLWLILRRLAVPGAWFAAVVFAVHPVHVESVTWMIELKDCLSGFFYLAALWAYPGARPKLPAVRYLLSLLLFVAGMLSKTMVVTLPVTLLLLHLYQRGGITKKDCARIAPFFVIGLTLGLVDWAIARTAGSADLPYSVIERIGIASMAFWFYLLKIFVPYPLHPVYAKWDTIGALPVIAALAAAGFIAFLFIVGRRLNWGPFVCITFFAITLGPVLGVIPFSYMQFSFAADRYLYLAAAGPIVLTVGLTTLGLQRAGAVRFRWGQAAGLVLITGLSVYSGFLCTRWYTNQTLFTHVLHYNPESWFAHQMLGIEAQKRQELAVAADHMNAALELNPEEPVNYRNAAVILLQSERAVEARQVINKGLMKWPADQKLLQLDKATSTTGT